MEDAFSTAASIAEMTSLNKLVVAINGIGYDSTFDVIVCHDHSPPKNAAKPSLV